MSIWEPYSEEARRSIVFAQEEAQRLHLNYISTAHLLFGILHEDTHAAKALKSTGVEPDQVLAALESALASSREKSPGDMMMTAEAQRVIDSSVVEARQLGTKNIGTDHVLLAIVREPEADAAAVLIERGAIYERLREAVSNLPERLPSQLDAGMLVTELTIRLFANGVGTVEATIGKYTPESALRAIEVLGRDWRTKT